MITGVKNTKKGFALPTVLISSIVMLIVLLTTVVSTVAVRTALLNQYYGQMAQSAGESGLVYAKACLAQSGGIAGWSNAKPLMPNTDCSGNEIVACPTAAADPKCYVSNTGNAYSSFSIKAPVLDSSGNASVLPNSGIVKLVRDSTGITWRTYTSPASQPTKVANLCSGSTNTSDGWSNSTVYSAGGTIPGFEDPNAKQVTIYDGGVAPGPQFFRRDFSVAEDGSYDFKLMADDIGYLYIDGAQVGSAALSDVFTSGSFNLSYGCHVATVKLVNTGLVNNPSGFKLAVTKSGGSDDVLVSDTSWRFSVGSLKHFSDVNYYESSNGWTVVRDYQDANSMTSDWNTISGVSARAISTTHSYTAPYNYPANSYTYFRDPKTITVAGITGVKVTYFCDDACDIYLDGTVIAKGSGSTSYINLTLAEGSHEFAISEYNGPAGMAEVAMSVTKISDGSALTYTHSGWKAAYFWETTNNASTYNSYDNNFIPTPTIAPITVPSMAEVNYVSDYSTFTLNGNASYNSSTGVLTLGTGFTWSPLLLVNKPTEVWVGGDFYANTASVNASLAPKGGWHLTIYYFGADGTTAVNNTWGYTANGCAQALDLGVWTNNDQRCRFAAGPNVVYVRYYLYSSASGYASPDLITKNSILTIH